MSANKKINARVQKWRTMINNGLFQDPELLKSRVRKGIPGAVRMVAWPQLVRLKSHIEQRSTSISYDKLVNSLSNNVYEIGLDIPRTFPQEQQSKYLRKSMNNILKAIAIVHPQIGYCQGMNFIALRLLQILDDQQSFWLLDYLFINDEHLWNNFIDPKHVLLLNHNFEYFVHRQSPNLIKNLSEKGIQLLSYTVKCFVTLFSSVFSQQMFYRVFEIYLLQGWSVIYKVTLALFKRNQAFFNDKEKTLEELHTFLREPIYDVKDIDDFLHYALKFDVTNQQIAELSRDYNKTLRDSQLVKHKKQIANRQQKNRQITKFDPQTQSSGTLIFQNKAEAVNLESLYILKEHNSSIIAQNSNFNKIN